MKRSNGEGHLEKLPSGAFRIVVCKVIDGKRERVSAYGKTREECLANFHKMMAGEPLSQRSITLHELAEQYISLKKESLEPTSSSRLEEISNFHLKPFFTKEHRVEEISEADIIEFYRRLRTEKYESRGEIRIRSEAVRRKAAALLKAILKTAEEKSLLQKSPMARMELPKSRRPELLIWSSEEASQFLESALEAKDPYEPFYRLALDSGLRLGELRGLKWRDLNWSTRELFVQRSIQELKTGFRIKETKTKSGRRTILLSQGTVNRLYIHYMKDANKKERSEFMFTERGSLIYKGNLHTRYFKPAMKRAGVKQIRFHDLRHTCASLLLGAGVNIKVVSERLGHSNIRTTLDLYAHCLPSMQEKAADTIGSLLERRK